MELLMSFSIQRETSDGTLSTLDLTIEYIDRTDVRAYVNDIEIELTGGVTPYTWEWITSAQIKITPNVPTGLVAMVKRSTPMDAMYHVYDAGAVFKDETVDENFKQVLFLSQEAKEGSGVSDIYSNVNMHGYVIGNHGAALLDGDLVTFGQYRNDSLGSGFNRVAAEAARDVAVAAKDTAVASATAAGNSAGAASTSATNAANSASASDAARILAQDAATTSVAAYDSFDDRYLGPKTTDPTLDNDGDALLEGALYWNTAAKEMRVYNGTAWVVAYLPVGAYVTEAELADVTDPEKGAGMVGWRREQLSGPIDTVGEMLSSQALNVWEFAHLITDKPSPLNPATWDWSPAFNGAIASLDTGANTVTGGVIHIPRGTYLIKSPVVITNVQAEKLTSITLCGAGMQNTIIRCVAGFVGDSVVHVDATAYVSVENISLDGNSLAKNGLNIAARAKAHMLIDRVLARGFTEKGFSILSYLITSRLSGCRALGGQIGFYANQITSMTFDHCYAIEATQAGFRIDNSVYCAMISCAADRCEYGYHVTRANGFSMISCGAEWARKSGFFFESSASLGGVVASLMGCTTVDCNEDGSPTDAGYRTHQADTGSIYVSLRECVDIDSGVRSIVSTGVSLNHKLVDAGCRFSTRVGSIATLRGPDAPSIFTVVCAGDGAPVEVCSMESLYGRKGHYGGLLNIVASDKRYNLDDASVANAIQYLLMVFKSALSAASTVEPIKVMGTREFDTDFPDFTFSINTTTNKLIATPRYTPTGTYRLYVTPISGVAVL